jgi:hypothetical protein
MYYSSRKVLGKAIANCLVTQEPRWFAFNDVVRCNFSRTHTMRIVEAAGVTNNLHVC